MAQATDSTAGTVVPQSTWDGWLIGRTVRNLRKSLRWAWLDTVCQYRRSRIGPLWETINVLVMTLGITVVSSTVIGGTMSGLIGYVGLGIIIWSAISGIVTEGSTTFVRNAALIHGTNVSIDFYVGRTIFRIFIAFAHHISLYFVAVAVALVPLSWTSLLAIPGILLLFANGFWIVTALAFICARFRDVELIIRNLLQLAFFVTPVFWDYRHIVSERKFIVDYNVLFYFVEIIRGPLLGEVPPAMHYAVVAAVTVIGYLLAYAAYRRMRRHLAFFV
jgi:ABC-type polysaccharide/polyol phosphate export permease